MMKVGISVWEDRISPVLDGCKRFLVLDVEDGKEIGREEVEIAETYLPFRARAILDLGIDVLICGAVSRPLAAMLSNSGISLVGWANGRVDDVLRAFLNKELNVTDFGTLVGVGARQGCRRFRHGRRGRFFNNGGKMR
ncbi:MAG TPA: NifB/NifX family molybdenum-iron cluster-binding protein [bacterium]|nr:NifB/NifX family molybdenum-iron cluster-binding protein [bacterium]